MSLQKIIDKFLEKPYSLDMGCKKLSNWWGFAPEDIRVAKKIVRRQLKEQIHKDVKILLLDVETTPLQAYIFATQVWKAQVSADDVISEWFLLSWSAKFLFEDKIYSDRVTSKEALKEDDSRIVKSLWKMLDGVDVVIGHNCDAFDLPTMNTRFVLNGLKPTKPYQTIDTNRIAKKQFGFTHNSLNALAKIFGFEQKLHTTFGLWKRCVNGEEEALAYMEEYNQRDVTLLEEVYLKLRPWIKNHPNIGLFIDSNESVCPACGSENLSWDGYYMTAVSRFPAFQCKDCGAIGRGRTSVVDKDKRKNLAISVVR